MALRGGAWRTKSAQFEWHPPAAIDRAQSPTIPERLSPQQRGACPAALTLIALVALIGVRKFLRALSNSSWVHIAF